MQKFAGMRTKANVVRKMSLPDATGEILSIAEDWICPARAVAFAELITFLLPNPALLRWKSFVLHNARDCSTKSQWCLVKYLHRRQEVRHYVSCMHCASQMCSAKLICATVTAAWQG